MCLQAGAVLNAETSDFLFNVRHAYMQVPLLAGYSDGSCTHCVRLILQSSRLQGWPESLCMENANLSQHFFILFSQLRGSIVKASDFTFEDRLVIVSVWV
jgi:hypothetical protein